MAEESGGLANSREAILDATKRLLADVPLDELTVAMIIKEAKAARATFYFYFASKDDAFLSLLHEVMAVILPAFESIIANRDRRRPEQLRRDIAAWLLIEGPERAVLRSAVEEWPRRAELRTAYLSGHARMVELLSQAIDEDRAAGLALGSIPSDLLADAWIWTMERSWYEAVGGADHLDDVPAVNDALAATLVAAVYGTPEPSP